MSKKIFLTLLAFLMAFCFFASCDNGGSDGAIEAHNKSNAPVKIGFNISVNHGAQKSIKTTYGDDLTIISYMKYTAIPQFSYTSGNTVQGTQTTMRTFTAGDTFYFAQGLWKFAVEAYSSQDVKLYEGETTVYINSLTSNVEIPVNALSGKGSINISLEVPQLSSTGGTLTLDYGLFGEDPETYAFTAGDTSRSNGKITFTKTFSNLNSGCYVLSFLFGDGTLDFSYAETVLVYVVANTPTQVTGDLPVGTLLVAGQTKEMLGNPGSNICLVCADNASKYIWKVDGVKVQEGDNRVFIYTVGTEGFHTVQCYLESESGAVATASIDARQAINITLHLQDKTQIIKTYKNEMDKNDLINNYLTGIYVKKLYTAAENGSGGGGSEYTNTNKFSANAELWAHRNWLTASFNANGGSGGSNISKYQGEKIGSVSKPTWKNHTFAGWYTAANGGTKIDPSTMDMEETKTYYAHWNEGEEKYWTVTFRTAKSDLDIGGLKSRFDNCTPVSVTVKDGDYLDLSKVTIPVESGYCLNAWYHEVNTIWILFTIYTPKTQFNFKTMPITKNYTMYGFWMETKGDSAYDVTYNTNGGSSIGSHSVFSGSSLVKPTDPTKAGCTFGGWYKDSACTQRWDFSNDVMPTNNLTLYALWIQNVLYIANTSTNGGWIDLGWKATDITKMQIDFEYRGSADSVIIGTDDPKFSIGTKKVTRLFEACYNNGVVRSDGYLYTEGRTTITFSQRNGLIIGSSNYGSVAAAEIESSDNICVFKTNSGTKTAVGRCYGIKIWEGSKQVRNLIPCQLSNGKYGLYDTIGEVLYPGQGNDFTAGN